MGRRARAEGASKSTSVRFSDAEQVLLGQAAGSRPRAEFIRDAALRAARDQVSGPWRCDHCTRDIEEPKHGWLQWSRDGKKLEIVHKTRHCMEPRWLDYHLSLYLGPGGAVELVKLLPLYGFPPDLFADVFHRLHVHGYEKARIVAIDTGLMRRDEPILVHEIYALQGVLSEL